MALAALNSDVLGPKALPALQGEQCWRKPRILLQEMVAGVISICFLPAPWSRAVPGQLLRTVTEATSARCRHCSCSHHIPAAAGGNAERERRPDAPWGWDKAWAAHPLWEGTGIPVGGPWRLMGCSCRSLSLVHQPTMNIGTEGC